MPENVKKASSASFVQTHLSGARNELRIKSYYRDRLMRMGLSFGLTIIGDFGNREFKWNIPLDDKLFDMTIPEGYRVVAQE